MRVATDSKSSRRVRVFPRATVPNASKLAGVSPSGREVVPHMKAASSGPIPRSCGHKGWFMINAGLLDRWWAFPDGFFNPGVSNRINRIRVCDAWTDRHFHAVLTNEKQMDGHVY